MTASAVVAGLALAATDPVAAAPPEPQTGTFELPTDFTFCAFPIVATLDGKGKTIEKERFTIATSPGLKITLEANGNSYVFNATGSFKITPQADGNVLYEYRGNNLVSDPSWPSSLQISTILMSLVRHIAPWRPARSRCSRDPRGRAARWSGHP